MRATRALELLRSIRDQDEVRLSVIEGQELVKGGLVDTLSRWEVEQRQHEVAELPTLMARQRELMAKVHRLEVAMDRSAATLLGSLLRAKGEEGQERDAEQERAQAREELVALRQKSLEVLRVQASLDRLGFAPATDSAYALNRHGWEVLQALEALPLDVEKDDDLETVLGWNEAVEGLLQQRIAAAKEVHGLLVQHLAGRANPTDLRPVAFVLAAQRVVPAASAQAFAAAFARTAYADNGLGGLTAALLLTLRAGVDAMGVFEAALRELVRLPLERDKRAAVAAVLAVGPVHGLAARVDELLSPVLRDLVADPLLGAALVQRPEPRDQVLARIAALRRALSAKGYQDIGVVQSAAALLALGQRNEQESVDRFDFLYRALSPRVDHPELAAAYAAITPFGVAEVLAHFDRAVRSMAYHQVGASPKEDASLALLVLQTPDLFAAARGLSVEELDVTHFPVLEQAFFSSILVPQHYLKVHQQVILAANTTYSPSWLWYRSHHYDHVYWGTHRRRWHRSHVSHFHGGYG